MIAYKNRNGQSRNFGFCLFRYNRNEISYGYNDDRRDGALTNYFWTQESVYVFYFEKNGYSSQIDRTYRIVINNMNVAQGAKMDII